MSAQHPHNSLVIATPEDDRFHAVTSDEKNWIETLWFPFWLPELRLTCYIHLHFCPNAGIYRGSVSAWKNDNEVVYMHRFEEALPSLREYGDLTNLRLPIGLTVRSLQAQKTFAVEYQHADCAFAFTFDSFMLPVMIAPDASPGMFHGHMNQAGRASGHIELAGQRSYIQCYTVRDRSWGPRKASTGHRAGNFHATGRDTSFYIYVKPDSEGNEPVTNGHLLIGNKLGRVVDGHREVDWDGNLASRITITLRDELGRQVSARGECLNQRLTLSPPNLCVALNLVKWHLEGELLWGESHDVWSEDAWISSGKSLPANH